MEICGMDVDELKAYLESETEDQESKDSRYALMLMIVALVSDWTFKFELVYLTHMQNDRDWEIAMDLLEQYRHDAGLFDEIIPLAMWLEDEKGVRMPRS